MQQPAAPGEHPQRQLQASSGVGVATGTPQAGRQGRHLHRRLRSHADARPTSDIRPLSRRAGGEAAGMADAGGDGAPSAEASLVPRRVALALCALLALRLRDAEAKRGWRGVRPLGRRKRAQPGEEGGAQVGALPAQRGAGEGRRADGLALATKLQHAAQTALRPHARHGLLRAPVPRRAGARRSPARLGIPARRAAAGGPTPRTSPGARRDAARRSRSSTPG